MLDLLGLTKRGSQPRKRRLTCDSGMKARKLGKGRVGPPADRKVETAPNSWR